MSLTVSHGKLSIGPIRVARSAWQRTRGLLGFPALQSNEGLLILHCNSVHTMGMQYPIDVVFLTKKGIVLKVVKNLKPWRFAGAFRASQVLEFRAGVASAFDLVPGSLLVQHES